MKQRGLSLEQINQETGIELEVLEQFLPQDTTPVIKETVGGFETQIEALFRQGKGAHEIGQMLGINDRAVLAYALEGESKTYSEASEQAPLYFRPPPTTTEETKQPQLTQTLPKPQHFLYSCQYHTTSCTGLTSSLERSPAMKCLTTSSNGTVVGGSLLITGGRGRDVVKLDVGTFAVLHQPPMHTTRSNHAALYHSQYVYVLGEVGGESVRGTHVQRVDGKCCLLSL
jgi:hypothetical protein